MSDRFDDKFDPAKLRAALAVDRALGLTLGPLAKLKRALAKPPALDLASARRILIVESHLIGDVVMLVPALRALRESAPSARITLVSRPWARPIVEPLGIVDELIDFSFPWVRNRPNLGQLGETALLVRRLRVESFDIAIDCRGDIRNSALLWLSGATHRAGYAFSGGASFLTRVLHRQPGRDHLTEAALDAIEQLGGTVTSTDADLVVGEHDREWAESIATECFGASKARLIGVHPGTSRPTKEWRADRFAEVINRLAAAEPTRFFIFGTEKERHIAEAILERLEPDVSAVYQQHGLGHYIALLSICSAVIAVDSSAGHLAAGLGVPVVTLFGPADADLSRPYSRFGVGVIKPVPCRPCDLFEACDKQESCMDMITTDDALAAANRALTLSEARK